MLIGKRVRGKLTNSCERGSHWIAPYSINCSLYDVIDREAARSLYALVRESCTLKEFITEYLCGVDPVDSD